MTFEAYETSQQDGSPLELYTFRIGVRVLRFASAVVDVLIGAETYAAAALVRPEIETGEELARSDLAIQCAADFPIALLFEPYPPSEVILLSIHRVHRSDGDLQLRHLWSGRVTSCNWNDSAQATLNCPSVFSSLQRPGLRRKPGRACPYAVYSEECGAVATEHRVSVTVDSVDGRTLHIAALDAFDDGRFAGGYVEWVASVDRNEKRAIKTHVGDAIELTHPIVGLTATATIFAYKGCKHHTDDCADEFDNLENNGGFPFGPTRNPFGSNGVF